MPFFSEEHYYNSVSTSNDKTNNLEVVNKFFGDVFGVTFETLDEAKSYAENNYSAIKNKVMFNEKEAESASEFIDKLGNVHCSFSVIEKRVLGFFPKRYFGATLNPVVRYWKRAEGVWETREMDYYDVKNVGMTINFKTSYSGVEDYAEFARIYQILEEQGLIYNLDEGKDEKFSLFIKDSIEYLETVLKVRYNDGELTFWTHESFYEKRKKTDLWNRYCPSGYRIESRRLPENALFKALRSMKKR